MAKILIVDDEAFIRQVLGDVLRNWGHEVAEAADGAEGLAGVQAERPDVVISDLVMPNLDGIGLVSALRADPTTSDLPIVLLSGTDALSDPLEGFKSGADIVVAKADAFTTLPAAVANLLGEPIDKIPPAGRLASLVTLGSPALDQALGGGVPIGHNILILGPSWLSRAIAADAFIGAGLIRGDPTMVVALASPPDELRDSIDRFLPLASAHYEESGTLAIIDGVSAAQDQPPAAELALSAQPTADEVATAMTLAGQTIGQNETDLAGGQRVIEAIECLAAGGSGAKIARLIEAIARSSVAHGSVTTLFLLDGAAAGMTTGRIERVVDATVEVRTDGMRAEARVLRAGWTETNADWIEIDDA